MKNARIQLEPLVCPSCMQKIEGAVFAVSGVDASTFKLGFNSGRLQVAFNDQVTTLEEIVDAIEKVGYPVKNARVR